MALRPNLKPNINSQDASENASGSNNIHDNPPSGTTEITGEGDAAAFIPEAVTFDPAAFFISLRDAIDAAHSEGKFNLDLFAKNFQQADTFTTQSLDTELRGLESFIPRTSNLIRKADAQGNIDILQNSDVFDARNENQVRRATTGNVALRSQLSEAFTPGLFKQARDQRNRLAGDVSRIRTRESQPFLSDVLKGVASRSARNQANDIAASTGLGTDSSAAINLEDRFDFDKRLQIAQLERQDARAGDQSIGNAETQVTNAGIQSQNLFNSIIAPGILDFKPLQPAPRVTDIGGQIRPMPAVDAGSIRREFTGQLNQVSMIQPAQVFSGSLDVQKFNSNVGIQALGFEQAQNNVAAAAGNNVLDQEQQAIRDATANDQFQAGLDQRAQSELIQGITGLITGGTVLAAEAGLFKGGAATVASSGAVGASQASVSATTAAIPGSFAVAGGEAAVIPASAAIPAGYTAIGSQALADGSAGVMIAPTGGSFLSTLGSAFLPAAGVVGGAAVGALQFQGLKAISEGKDPTLLQHAALFAVTGGFDFLAKPISSIFGSGKSEDQQARDEYRQALKEGKLVDSSYNLKLADGTKFDLGKDGSAELANVGTNYDGKTTRNYYDLDFSAPNAGTVAAMTNALSTVLFNTPDATKFVGHLANAITAKDPGNLENAKLNAKGIATQAGVTYSDGVKRLDALKEQLGDDRYQVYRNSWFNLYFS